MRESDHREWRQLVTAAKAVEEALPPPAAGPDLEAPMGFSTRVAALAVAEGRGRGPTPRLLRRCSLAAAACSLALFLGAAFHASVSSPEAAVIPIPVLSFSHAPAP